MALTEGKWVNGRLRNRKLIWLLNLAVGPELSHRVATFKQEAPGQPHWESTQPHLTEQPAQTTKAPPADPTCPTH